MFAYQEVKFRNDEDEIGNTEDFANFESLKVFVIFKREQTCLASVEQEKREQVKTKHIEVAAHKINIPQKGLKK